MSSQFRNLIAWQKSVDLAVRTSVSVPSNLAEGCGRWTLPDYRRFLLHARGSTYELETQIEIAKRTGLIDEAEADTLISDTNEVERLLNGMIRRLNTNK